MTAIPKKRRIVGTVLLGAAVLLLLCCILRTGYLHIVNRSAPDLFQIRNREIPVVSHIPETELVSWINRADAETLSDMPGIGESLASAIAEEREVHGPFHYPEDLVMVNGIGQKKLQHILETFIIPDT